MALEGFVFGLSVAIPIGIFIHLALSLRDAAFAVKHGRGRQPHWVRGDAGFQAWLAKRRSLKVKYSQRMLLLLGQDTADFVVRGQRVPFLTISYGEIDKITTESFRSRSLGGRGVRLYLKNGGNFCIRAEILWFPALFASPSVTEALARDLAAMVKNPA